jgi:hypothetical protein
MDSKEDIIDIINEEVVYVYADEQEYIDTNNGLLNKDYLRRRKEIFFKKNTLHLIDDIVQTKQHFPVNDVSSVDMKMDAVVIKKSDLDRILKYIEGNE